MNLKPLALALAGMIAATGAQAINSGYSGTLNASSPTFNRTRADFMSYSPNGANVFYDAHTFTVTASGSYDFVNATDGYDGYLYLYIGSFDPNQPMLNGVIGNDDLTPGGDTTLSGFTTSLTAGTTYILVSTAFQAGSTGNFNLTATGPGVIAAVPEPSTYGLLALGLGVVCAARRRKMAA